MVVYSEEEKNYFCKYCAIVSHSKSSVKGGHHVTEELVIQDFENLKKRQGNVSYTWNSTYHKTSVSTAEKTKTILTNK